ncbi:dihydroxy-acid dehydratase [bacterium]|nr:dihydroxy-acid dehydratase [bacterium]MBU1754462.1 dihydroxy-acid dehydratase [bacterium]
MRSDVMKKGLKAAPHRCLFKAMGYTTEEINRPLIGIANSANQIVPGHIHLDKIAEAVAAGIRMAGGTPIEFSTIGVCDGIAMNHDGMKYSLVSREIIADSVEIMAKAHPFDAMVFVPNCDKIVPGMMMAAVRLNVPSIFISGGPMLAGRLDGHPVQLISVFEGIGRVLTNKMQESELTALEDAACPGCGSCAGMFTANSMNCLTEALGMGLAGNGTIPAVEAARIRLAKEAGKKIMELLQNNIRPRDIITEKSLSNAITVDMALGCSTNTVLHLTAIAHEARISLDLNKFDEISRKTPHLCDMCPAGPHFLQDLNEAGGIPSVMAELTKLGLLNLEAMTCTGYSVGENLRGKKTLRADVIRTIDNPYHPVGGIAIMKGNLAPDGCVVKQSAVLPEMMVFSGTAKVFGSEEEATDAIITHQIKKGDVVVIRYEGPKGGPGMREMLTPTSAIVGMELDSHVALITDGRFSGGTRGAAIGHISPEAAEGGPIALIQNGDTININIPNRTLDLEVSSEELFERRKQWKQPKPKVTTGVLARYAAQVTSGSMGAVLR